MSMKSGLTTLNRRTFILGGAIGLPALAGCVAPTSPGAALATSEEGIPFSTLRDFSSEPYDVRRINRARFDPTFAPTIVPTPYAENPGTIVVDTRTRHLYLVEPGGKSRRYGIAVGDAGYGWEGRAVVGRKAKWPAWHPTPRMRAQTAGLPTRIAPGAENPLGARALDLYQGGRDTLYRIHGTSEPWTIGTKASSGCIRMFNEDVIDLFDRVKVGAPVLVLQ
jgi:lipoprotein-anchoring transpeptidase ErfK/SrfK